VGERRRRTKSHNAVRAQTLRKLSPRPPVGPACLDTVTVDCTCELGRCPLCN